ncbi:hypothetical protein TD95_000743 [Thielaviopsis punctulata]|uniref:Glycosyl transferase CAP10 domain-containing protein n=1 Tax=Thielaviopsis punctulata TaxID=72032 RepID=A0A0F4ZKX5_9PEZI|nr:hypothetical protein TD95_000743 [Thielaviopsis punctulata]
MLNTLGHSISRRPQFVLRLILRYLLVAAAIVCLFKYLIFVPSATDDFRPVFPSSPESESAAKITVPLGPHENHPIDRLVHLANQKFDNLLLKQTTTLPDAAAAYRARRGRHPPPGFDQWHAFAAQHDAIIVEDFFDQVYRDLEPFWGVAAAKIRKDADDYEMRISVRNHTASSTSDWFWTQIWLNLTATVESMLPDMDIALNSMDEPRLVVRAEEVDEYMAAAAKTRNMPAPSHMKSTYKPLPAPRTGDNPPMEWETTGRFFFSRSYWDIARRGCPANSLARHNVTPLEPFKPVKISMHLAKPHMENGFVSNYTLMTDFCHQPDLQNLEGIFLEPLTIKASDKLLPLFGGSKLAVNNEILLPAPMYWKADDRFMGAGGANVPWAEKLDMVSWRGVATGGHTRNTTWHGFQRHRFVAMNNATALYHAQMGEPQMNFGLPDPEYNLEAMRVATTADADRDKYPGIGHWLAKWSDVGFVDLMCFPTEPAGTCHYLDAYYSQKKAKTLDEQFRYKYMPDIDGNSFSGRYLGFLRSTSLPIKSALWREWHDDRLVAWKHFVPMDNRFGDYYAIMEYFLGAGNNKGHDEVAKAIALDGQAWANRVLRKQDMQIYVLRLLLEYARVSSDDRETLGYTADLE